MSKLVDWLDLAVMALVARVSGRMVAIIALVLYPGIGLVLPLALAWPMSWLVTMNMLGVTFAAVVSLGWLIARIEAANRRRLLEWTTDLRLLSAEEFEWLVGEVFRREGWKVRETGSQDGPDGNIDLELTRGRDQRLVQCKRWRAWHVGVDEIRSFAGALLRENLRGNQGVFVTLSRFNEHAIREAAKNGIELIDGADLFRRVERVRRPEPCPTCGNPMMLGRSRHGWWFRCTAGTCAGKRDLDKEPARAVDLLTQAPMPASAQSR